MTQTADVTKYRELGQARLEADPTPSPMGPTMLKATFRTPHGIAVDLWGFPMEQESR